jgi:hypothetical protein
MLLDDERQRPGPGLAVNWRRLGRAGEVALGAVVV